MPRTYSPQQAGRIGGLTLAATAPSPQAITQAARAGRDRKYMDLARQLCPEVTDEAELSRRTHLLLQADMTRLSAKAAAARRLRAERVCEPFFVPHGLSGLRNTT